MTASQAEQRYNFEINSQEVLNEINRLEKTYGVDMVRKWNNEGMPREIMGIPKEMKQFYETESTQQRTTPVQRSPKTDSGPVQNELRSNKKTDTIKNLPDLTQKIKESTFGKWTKQVFQDLQPRSRKGPNSSKATLADPNPQPEQQSIPRAETSPSPIGNQSIGTPLPTPTVLAGSISAVDLTSPLPPIFEHDSELSSIHERASSPQSIPQIQTGTSEIEPASTQPSPRTQLPTTESGPELTQEQYLADQFNQYNRHAPSQPSPEGEARLQREAVDYINTVETTPGVAASMHVPGKYLPTVDRSVDETKQKARAHAERFGLPIPEPDQTTGVATGRAKRRESTSPRPIPQIRTGTPHIDPVLTQEQYLADQFNQYTRRPPSQPSPETEARLQQQAVDFLSTVEIAPGQDASMYVPGIYLPTVDRSVDETKQKATAYAKRLGITTSEPDSTTGVTTGKAKRILSSGLPGTKNMTFRSRLPPEMRNKQKLRDKVKIAESKGETETKKSLETEIETANRSNAAKIGERTKQLQQHLGAPTLAANGKTDAENRQEAISKAQDEMIDATLRTHTAFFNSIQAEKSGSSTAGKQAKIQHKAAQQQEKQRRQTNQKAISNYISAESELHHPWGPRVNLGSELERRKRLWKAVQRDNTVYGNRFCSYFKGGKQMERDAIRVRAKQMSLATGLLPLGFFAGFFL